MTTCPDCMGIARTDESSGNIVCHRCGTFRVGRCDECGGEGWLLEVGKSDARGQLLNCSCSAIFFLTTPHLTLV